jgi:hypothetical protein
MGGGRPAVKPLLEEGATLTFSVKALAERHFCTI